MEQDFMEILFKHVKGRKVTRKSPQVQALDLTPVACFPHSGLRCKILCRLAKSVTSDSAEILSLCTNICVLVVTLTAADGNGKQAPGVRLLPRVDRNQRSHMGALSLSA